MLLNVLLTLVTAAQLASAGILHRRAALAPAKILEELTNVAGRDFCHVYINAQVLVLNDVSTVSETKIISKIINTKVTSTLTETIGTLRKGTTTTTVLATITSGPGRTRNLGPTTTTTFTFSTTGTNTITTYYQDPWIARLRRRALATPAAVADSDPLSISAACIKVINKYPIYTTAASATTKSFTTTVSTTSTSTIVKVQKVTQINPYSIKTISSLTTVGNNRTTTTISVLQTETRTTTEIIGPTVTLSFKEECHADANGNLLRPATGSIRRAFPIAGQNTHDIISYHGGEVANEAQCCERCSRWHDWEFGRRVCMGFHVDHNAEYDTNLCIVVAQETRDWNGELTTCPGDVFGLWSSEAPADEGWQNYKAKFWPGPCFTGAKMCNEDWQTCTSTTSWMN